MPYHPIRCVVFVARALFACVFIPTPAALAAEAIAAAEASRAPSTAWTTRVWKSDDGLPNNHVTGLAQTPDGYLWVATYSAPARFDGTAFEQFLPRDLGLGANQKISALALARDGALWLGSLHGGVIRLDAHGAQTFGDGLPYKPVEEIVEDSTGALWVTHQGGTLARFHAGKLTPFGPAEGLPRAETPTRYVCSLATDRDGTLWFSKDGHVGRYRDGRLVSLLRLGPLNARIARASIGGLWIAAEGKLLRFQPDSAPAPDTVAQFTSAATTQTTALLEDRHGHVWIGTATLGLFRFDGTHLESIATSDARITNLVEDRKGHLWVGTVGGGLNQLRPRIVTIENESTGLPTGIVQSIAEDTGGTLWATTQTGLLLRRAGSAWQTISAGPKWPGGRAAAIAADPAGALWIGTRDRALHRWHDGVFTSWRRPDGLASREIHALVVARNGDIWLGQSSPDLVQRWRAGRFDTFAMPEGIRVIRAMAEDHAGNLWVGSSRGYLVRIRDDAVIDETRRTSGEPWSIRCLRVTADGTLWIGYADEGVGLYKEGHYIHLSPARGFPEPNVSQIVPEDAGWLWFAGNHGIFKVRQAELEAFAREQGPAPHFVRYGRSEGLNSLEANFGDTSGTTRTRDGRLWIPLRTGLAVIDPSRAAIDPAPPTVLLKRVLVDDRVLAAYGGTVPVRAAADLSAPAPAALRIPPSHYRLTFEYAALNFRAPENARFRSRLEGFDRDWTDSTPARAATYSRLPAGDYRFLVQACNSDGIWTEQGVSLAFSVPPFTWQTWWFRGLAFVLFTTATVIVVRRISLRRVARQLAQLEQQAAVHKERTRIARDLHDEFGTRLTELGLIAELERRAPTPRDSDLLAHIRALERDLDAIVWTVNPKNDTLDHLVGFLSRVSTEFLGRSAIRCRLDIPDDLPAHPVSPELRHNVVLIVREALANVARHAGASCVKLSVAFAAGTLELRLVDDGCGFSVASAESSPRNGLKNMRTRIEELGGEFHLTSTAGTGTTLVARVPLGATRSPSPLVARAAPVPVSTP